MKKSKKSIMFGLLISFALLFSNHNYHSLNNETNNNTPLYKVVEKENIPTSIRVWKDSDTAWTIFGVTMGISLALVGIMIYINFKKGIYGTKENKKDKEEK